MKFDFISTPLSWLIKGLLTLLLILVTIITLLCTTSAGIDAGIKLLNKSILPGLAVEAVEGSMMGQLTLLNLRYQDDTQAVQIDKLCTEFSFLKLLYGQLHFKKLLIGNIDIKTTVAKKNQQTSALTAPPDDFLSSIADIPNVPQFTFALRWDQLIINSIQTADVKIHLIDSRGIAKSNSRTLQLDIKHLRGFIDTAPLSLSGKLFWRGKQLSAEKLSLTYQDNHFMLDGIYGKTLTWSLRLLQTAQKQNIDASGSLTGAGKKMKLRASIKANVQQGGIILNNLHADLYLAEDDNNHIQVDAKQIKFQQTDLHDVYLRSQGKFSDQHFTFRTQDAGKTTVELTGHWQIKLAALFKKRLDGSIQFKLNNMKGILASLLSNADVDFTQGEVSGDVTFSGPFSKVNTKINLLLQQGEVVITPLGITLKNIKLLAEKLTLHSNTLKLTGSANSGKGALTINGQAELDKDNPSVLIDIVGKELQIFNTKEFDVTATPTLQLSYKDSLVDITGDILIPSARIHPEKIVQSDHLSDDFIFVPSKKEKAKQQKKASAASEDRPLPLQLDVTVKTGKKVSLKYGDFSANLAGELKLKKTPTRNLTAQGEVLIQDGVFVVRQQKLQISQGRLIYLNDAIADPRLDVTATRTVTVSGTEPSLPSLGLFNDSQPTEAAPKATEVKVGVQVTGKASKPKYKLFSSPSNLPANKILSYLILGHEGSASASDGAGLLLQAASGLNLTGKDKKGLTEQVQSFFKLDKVGIGSVNTLDTDSHTFTPKTALNVGKKLSSRLYLDYTVGLFDPINILKLRYKLMEGWVVQTETDQDSSGIDLFYHFESD